MINEPIKDDIPMVARIFPEMEIIDGRIVINKDKIPEGFKYMLEKNKKLYEENRDEMLAMMDRRVEKIMKEHEKNS